ncbi:hypothetical protein PoB_005057100 [Plakobranchus ocellatus]|uniref:Uncharacterized protein n=1 Tax=Plakobranchus ocellatus TaxID=259542 RepID=A0AAV4BU95_9GAST|nr:hypothetical protein PoB_005057100 [Plakobranchus ocellatus]
MNPLSRVMKLVRLAQQHVALEIAMDMLDEALEPNDITGWPSPSPLPEDEAETSFNDISITDLLPVTNLDNVSIDEQDTVSHVNSFNSYLPHKTNIFTNGNLITNTPMFSASVDCLPPSEAETILQTRNSSTTNALVNVTQDKTFREDIDTEDNHGVLEKRDHEDADSQRDEDFPDFAKSNGQYQDHKHVGFEEDEAVRTPLADHEHLEHAQTSKDDSLPSSTGRALTEEVEELQDRATEVNEITPNENQSMPSPSQISQTPEASSSKKRKADQTKWKKNVNKSRRSNGEVYMCAWREVQLQGCWNEVHRGD